MGGKMNQIKLLKFIQKNHPKLLQNMLNIEIKMIDLTFDIKIAKLNLGKNDDNMKILQIQLDYLENHAKILFKQSKAK